MTYVSAATCYRSTDDVCLVTTYFNPAGFTSKRVRYAEFADRIAGSGLRLVTIECAFGDADFELPASPDMLRLRASRAMWQKERLINVAIERLPETCRKIVWIDSDVYFENPDWATDASRLLDSHPLVQPFETAYWLPRGATAFNGEGAVFRGFAASYGDDPDVVTMGDFQAHGVPGYAWAARRELLERHGLYDACVIGGGDHLFAHAACGDWSSKCFSWSLGLDSAHHRHFVRWARGLYADVQGHISFVPGGLLHMWHGSWKNRNYTHRHKGLMEFDFDPSVDVRIGADGCWEWSSDKPALHEWVADYFANRREDDTLACSIPTAAERLR